MIKLVEKNKFSHDDIKAVMHFVRAFADYETRAMEDAERPVDDEPMLVTIYCVEEYAEKIYFADNPELPEALNCTMEEFLDNLD